MIRIFVPAFISLLLPAAAVADEVRVTTFPSVLQGTWVKSADQCAAKDNGGVSIGPTKYGDATGTCDVRWIVQTAAPRGTNYAVHAQCTSASQPPKTEVVDIVIRPQGTDRAVMGRSFDDLKTYQRCPAH